MREKMEGISPAIEVVRRYWNNLCTALKPLESKKEEQLCFEIKKQCDIIQKKIIETFNQNFMNHSLSKFQKFQEFTKSKLRELIVYHVLAFFGCDINSDEISKIADHRLKALEQSGHSGLQDTFNTEYCNKIIDETMSLNRTSPYSIVRAKIIALTVLSVKIDQCGDFDEIIKNYYATVFERVRLVNDLLNEKEVVSRKNERKGILKEKGSSNAARSGLKV